MTTTFRIVWGEQRHGDAMMALLPELASFEIPARREPEHLWHGDRDMVVEWLAGGRPECFVHVAECEDGTVAGFAFVSMREELLSHAPSAHLEVLVVNADTRGAGLGRVLSEAAHEEARRRGAETITLHVFGNNARARGLYAKLGYDEELIRCIKDL